jgi:branched-chain amino acid transport system permease protein
MAIIVAFLLPVLIRGNDYFLSVFILCVINIILASSLRTIASTGQLCVGVMAFAGIGAYTSALLMMKLGLPIWATLPLSGIAALLIAAIIAYPSVRVTGFYFAMMTLFFVQVVGLVLTEWRGLTGGSNGINPIPSIGTLSIASMSIDFGHFLPYAYFALAIMVISLLVLYRIDRSHFGTFMSSIEQDEVVSRSVGINTVSFKVVTFCVGAFFAGIAGCLYAHYLKVIVPDSFSLSQSIYIVIAMVAGGRKAFEGPIIGAIIMTLLPQVFISFAAYQPFIYVLALYLVLYLLPGGIVDLPMMIRAKFFMRRERGVANG